MFIFFVEFICARSSSKFLWQWNDTLSNACPATYEVAMAKGHLMTSQTAVFANPFVTSQRALSDNPIDDVTDSTVLNARQPRSPTSGSASSIEHYEIGTICLEYWRQISNDGEVIDRHHDIRIMWGMYASSYHICDVKRGYITNWILVFDRQHNLVITQKSRLLLLLNFIKMMHVDCERFNMVCVAYCISFALL